MSTLGAQTVSRCEFAIPMYGTSRGDVIPETGAPPAVGARLTLTLAGLPVVVTVVTSGSDGPDNAHVVVKTGVGWDVPLVGRSYESAAGVRLATVLRDLARDAGETFAAFPPDKAIGFVYDRPGSTAAHATTGRAVLAMLWRLKHIPPWWVDLDGRTQFGPRPAGAVVGRVDVIRRRAQVGLRVLGIDAPAGFLPGRTIEGTVIRKLVIQEKASSLTAEAYS